MWFGWNEGKDITLVVETMTLLKQSSQDSDEVNMNLTKTQNVCFAKK